MNKLYLQDKTYADANAIFDCVPFFDLETIINTLEKFNHEKDSVRIELALQELFKQRDSDTNFQHQKERDVHSILTLLPHFTKQEVNECADIVGKFPYPHRKAVILRLLIWKYGKRSNKKRPLDIVSENVEAKRRGVGDNTNRPSIYNRNCLSNKVSLLSASSSTYSDETGK